MAMHERWFSNPTQVYWTCKALIEGRTINHQNEIREVKGWRLGAIIHRLRSEFDWPIDSEYRGAANIKHYWLAKGTDPTRLTFPPSAEHLLEELFK